MPGKVKHSDIIEPKVFQPTTESAELLLKSLLDLEKQYKKLLTITAKKVETTSTKDYEGIKKVTTAINTHKTAVTELEKTQKRIITTEKQLIVERGKAGTQLARQQEALTQQRKINRELAKDELALAEAGRKNIKSIKDLRIQTNALTRLRDKQDISTKKGQKAFALFTSRIRANNAALLKHDAAIGRSQRNVGNYAGSIKRLAGNFAGALGLTGGIFLAIRAFKAAGQTMVDFEQNSANLASIFGKTRDQITELTDDAIRLGGSTVKTAGDVLMLQEAYARLGFSQESILKLTEPTIDGSIALRAELGATAEIVGAMVNSFDDFSEIDATLIIDQMTVATQRSALNFEKLQKGLPIVAGAANAAGISFTQLLALMGKLADAGIDVSTSSTAIRNIFIKSAAKGADYAQIIEDIKNSQDKLTTATNEFGVRAAVSAAVLAQNIDATKELDEALQGAGGTAKKVAENQLKTLNGAILLLKSAWDGLILGMNKGDGVTSKLAKVVRFLAENLGAVLKVLGRIAMAFVAYKIGVLAYNVVITATAIKTSLAAAATIKLNAAMKRNIWGLIASVIAIAGSYLLDWITKTEEATDVTAGFNEEIARERAGMETLFTVLKNAKEGTRERTRAIKEINELYGEYLPNLLTEKSTLEEIEAAQKLVTNALIRDIAIRSRQTELLEANTKVFEVQTKVLNMIKKSIKGTAAVVGTGTAAFIDLAEAVTKTNAKLFELGKDVLPLATKESKEAQKLISEFAEKINGLTYEEVEKALVKYIAVQEHNETVTRSINEQYNAYIDSLGKVADGENKAAGATTDSTNARIETIKKLQKQISVLNKQRNETEISDIKEFIRIDQLIDKYQKLIASTINRTGTLKDLLKAQDEEELSVEEIIDLNKESKEIIDEIIVAELKRLATIKFTAIEEQRIAKQQRDRLNATLNLGTSVFDGLRTSSQINATNQIKDLERQKEAELRIVGDNADQKAIIEEKYQTKIEAERRAAFEKNKQWAIAQARIDGAIAITRILASTGTSNFIVDAVLQAIEIAAVITTTELQVANINKTTFGEGGVFDINGDKHSDKSGGERLLDHVYVEDKEKVGILSPSASQKHGNLFETMTNAMNADDISWQKLLIQPRIFNDQTIQMQFSEAVLLKEQQETNRLLNIIKDRPYTYIDKQGNFTIRSKQGIHTEH